MTLNLRSISAALPLLALTAPAAAQASVEDFESGNPDGWEIWWTNYNNVEPTGGNPGAYLELDNFTTGAATCQFLDIAAAFPGAAPLPHAGDWRAAGVTGVSIDVNIEQGAWSGDLTLNLRSDPGTPGVTSDDCIVSLNLVAVGSAMPGWTTYSFNVPAAMTTAPAGWTIDPMSACGGFSVDAAWNSVMVDVDEMWFRYDANPAVFCSFTNWIFGVDNIAVYGNGSGPGTNFCTSVPNSSGAAAVMSASGSRVVADDDLTLRCEDMPNGSFAFFLTSRDQGFTGNPGGSQGNLCLGGSIGRFVGPGQIQNSGSLGEVSLALDLSQHPTPSGLVPVLAGDTWHFTCWFRDVVGGASTSNFADGYTVVFQ